MLAGRRRVSWHPDYPRKDDQDAATMVRADDPHPSWGPRHIVRTFDGIVLGSIGFFGSPAAAETRSPRRRWASAWSRTPAATVRSPRR